METDILKSLNFEMGSPTARTFLRYVLELKLFHLDDKISSVVKQLR